MSKVKGYKVFKPDWTCRGFQYEVGKTFEHDGDIGLCSEGFHFCQKASNCFNYYRFNSNNKVAEVEAIGLVKTEGDKSVTNKIRIIREIPGSELLTIVNEGEDCIGIGNIGNRNTGDWNVGDWNVGDWNVGDWNTGHCNTGNRNVGDKNTGGCNIGDRNTGDWNLTNYSTGLFNTEEKMIDIFDKPSNWTLKDWFNSDVREILIGNFKPTVWINKEDMTDEEKKENPTYKTTGGYLKVFEFKEACKNMWSCLTTEERNTVVTKLPNFDSKKFELITGINVEEREN